MRRMNNQTVPESQGVSRDDYFKKLGILACPSYFPNLPSAALPSAAHARPTIALHFYTRPSSGLRLRRCSTGTGDRHETGCLWPLRHTTSFCQLLSVLAQVSMGTTPSLPLSFQKNLLVPHPLALQRKLVFFLLGSMVFYTHIYIIFMAIHPYICIFFNPHF